MTQQLKAMSLALEVLEKLRGFHAFHNKSCEAEITALRQAIEKAEQQVTSLQCAHCQETIDTLNDKVMYLMKQAQKQEPVAYIGKDKFERLHDVGLITTSLTTSEVFQDDVALYTSPPQGQPLTDEQRMEICAKAEAAFREDKNLSWRNALISETEAAIKGEQK